MLFDLICRNRLAVLVASLAVPATNAEAPAGGGCPPSGSVGTWVWDGGGDGVNWHSANNWNPNSVPPDGADVIINDAAGPVEMVHPMYYVTVRTLSCNSVLRLREVPPNGGIVLIIQDCATIHTLEMSASIINGPDFAVAPVLTITNHLQSTSSRFGTSLSGIVVRIPQGATATLLGTCPIEGLGTLFEIDGALTLDGATTATEWGAQIRIENDGQSLCGSVADPPGLLIMKNNSVISGNASHPLIINGCLRTEGADNAGLVYNIIQINGSLAVSNGTQFRIGGGGTCNGGSISVDEDATLDIARVGGGPSRFFTADANSSISCAPTGTIRHYSSSGGTTFTVNCPLDVQGTWKQEPPGAGDFGAAANFNGSPKRFANYEFGGQIITGNASIVISNNMKWTDGTIAVPVLIESGASIDIMPTEHASDKYFPSLMQVGGTANHTNTWVSFNEGTLQIMPGGILTMNSGSVLSGGAPTNNATVLNQGTITTGPGHTTSFVGTIFTNAGTLAVNEGTIQFGGSFNQTAGQTVLNGGSLQSVPYFNPTFVFNGGTLRGNNTITGNVTNNAGTVACGLSPGTITVTGNYQQGAAGTLAVEMAGLAAGTQYDQLQVTGTASLNGSMTAVVTDGFVPNVNDTFTVLSAGTVTGSLSQCCYLDPFFFVTYGPTSLDLTRVAPCPADIVCSRSVDVDDLIAVILVWGPYQPPATACSADVVPSGGDSQVNVDDLIAVILGWGPCP
jgi:hypothetical protein